MEPHGWQPLAAWMTQILLCFDAINLQKRDSWKRFMPKISKAQMSKLFYRLEKTYSAGIDLLTALRRESEQGSLAFRSAMKSIADRVAQGNSLAESIAALGDYFPPLVVSVVKAGERGGRLEDSFRRLSQHFNSLVQFRQRLMAKISWPLFELGFSIVVVGVMILILGFILESGDLEPIDWFGLKLGTVGNFILYWVIVLILLSGAFILIFGSMKGWFGQIPMRIAKRIPLVGKTIESLSLSRFAWTLSVAENAGMTPQESTQLALESTQNFYFTDQIGKIRREIDARKQLHVALGSTGVFPREFLMYVENGETAGELAETMDRVSVDLQETAENNLRTIATIGFVLTFLFTSVVIGGAVIILFKKVYIDQIQNISNGF
jgi:type IV pilus assembly protein PilC